MSYTTFTIEGQSDELPTIEQLASIWADTVEDVHGNIEGLLAELEYAEDYQVEPEAIHFELESKYGYPGVENFGRAASAEHPGTKVSVYERTEESEDRAFLLRFEAGREVHRSVLDWHDVEPIN